MDTPPLTWTPGQRRLISRVASMKAFAYSSCSSSPVAIARMLGSMMMSLGSNPASVVSRRTARSAISILRSTVPAWPSLVEAHHDHGRAVVPDLAGLREEVLLALLQADRIDDALALDALQPGLEGLPARAVDHDRHAGDLGLGGDQVQEAGHRLLGIEEVGVHVDVEHVGAAAHLVERHVDGGLEVARFDQAPELRAAGDVLALADHHEPGVACGSGTARGR